MVFISTNKRRPGYNKSVVDTLGSVDDYGATAEFPILEHTPKENQEKSAIKVFAETETEAVLGRYTKTKDEIVNYIVEKKETKFGTRTTVWPLRPFCKWCSPASNRKDDDEWTSGWSDDGAEVRMTKRDARLNGVPPDNFYSFTLVERHGELFCTECRQNPTQDTAEHPIITVATTKRNPTIYDLESPQKGIKVGKSVARFPAALVSYWVESKSLDEGLLVFAKGKNLYSIEANKLLSESVLDETNNEWLLGLTKCSKTRCLPAQTNGTHILAPQDTVVAWRKTALSVENIVAADNEGITYTIPLHLFLARGGAKGSNWMASLDYCEGPYFMTTDVLSDESKMPKKVEAQEKPRQDQSSLFDFK